MQTVIPKKLNIQKVIVSPPFGTYLNLSSTTPVIGTFTLERRKGLYRQAVKTFRLHKGGYINKIGLRNIGLPNFAPNTKARRSILSIAALEDSDWAGLHETLLMLKERYDYIPPALELNLSCPNVDHKPVINSEMLGFFQDFDSILKLPPTDACLEYIEIGLAAGITHFHMCNTLPSPRGGISGKLLKEKSLPYVQEAKKHYGDRIKVIGGGGVYSIKDAKDYLDAGCEYMSLASVAFNPFKFMQVLNYINQQGS